MRHPGVAFAFGTDVMAAVFDSDIVCTVISAVEPVVFGDWIALGAHLNLVGASIPSKREIDEETVARAALFVDYGPSTLAQAGKSSGPSRAAVSRSTTYWPRSARCSPATAPGGRRPTRSRFTARSASPRRTWPARSTAPKPRRPEGWASRPRSSE